MNPPPERTAVEVVEEYSAIFAQQAETIRELRDQLAETEQICAEQADTIAALRVEIHLLRKRYGLTPESAMALLGVAMGG